jgi:hypothetical protein
MIADTEPNPRQEGIENLLSGDVETSKIILRDFINATVGFTKLSDVTRRCAKARVPHP